MILSFHFIFIVVLPSVFCGHILITPDALTPPTLSLSNETTPRSDAIHPLSVFQGYLTSPAHRHLTPLDPLQIPLYFPPFRNYHWRHFLQKFQQDRECISTDALTNQGKLDIRLVRQAEPEWYRLTRNIWFESVKRRSRVGAKMVWRVFFPNCKLGTINLLPGTNRSDYHIRTKPFVFVPKGKIISSLKNGKGRRSLPSDSVVVHIFSEQSTHPSNPLLIYVQFDKKQRAIKNEHHDALFSIMAFKRTVDRNRPIAPLLPFESSPEMLVDWGKLARATYMDNPNQELIDTAEERLLVKRRLLDHARMRAIPNYDLVVKSIHSSADFLLIPGIPLADIKSHDPPIPQSMVTFPNPILVLKFPHASKLIATHEQHFHYHPQHQHTLTVPSQVQDEHLAYLLDFSYDYSSLNQAIEEMISPKSVKRILSRALPYSQEELEEIYQNANFPDWYLTTIKRPKPLHPSKESVMEKEFKQKEVHDALRSSRRDGRSAIIY